MATTSLPTIHCGDDLPHAGHVVRNTGDAYTCVGTPTFEQQVAAQTELRFVGVGGELADEQPILRSLRGLKDDFEHAAYTGDRAWDRLYVVHEGQLVEVTVKPLSPAQTDDDDYTTQTFTVRRPDGPGSDGIEVGQFTTHLDGRS